tara:strand:+ start:80977 stop:82986 length:2010 start_codon:yes stop_codon:yes gene_type:complete
MEPIKISNKLFNNPKQNLKYSEKITAADGTQVELADPRATRALVSLMDMNAVLGGAASHYGGPAAFAELMSALHGLMFNRSVKAGKSWTEQFHFVNDAGHCENGLYALKANYELAGLQVNSLKQFRSITSPLTGHGEVHLFGEGVFLSNGPLGSAFPQTLGLAMGEKLSATMRTTVCAISDGACMEGEAREAMASVPGLAAKGLLAPYVLIISDNNTKLSGRIDKDSFSMTPTFESLKTLGWDVITLEKGNDLKACYDAIQTALDKAQKNPKVPVAIHAKTVKGIGTKKTAESSSGGHGFPLKSPKELTAFVAEIYDGKPYPKEFDVWIEELIQLENQIIASGKKDSGEKIQKGVASAMIQARKAGLPVLSVTSDLPGSTGVADFRKEFPEASFDVGVAESNMVSAAAGLSKLGYIPVVDTFAQFGVTKGALPLTMASLSEAPVIGVFSHTGFQDAADGASHQALSYVAMLSSIPYVDIYNLSCSEEAHELVKQAIESFPADCKKGITPRSKIFFLGRENFPKNYGATGFKLGQPQTVSENLKGSKTVTIVASGSTVQSAVNAAAKLEKDGIGAVVINQSQLNSFQKDFYVATLKKSNGHMVVVEDHQKIGGLGQALQAFLNENRIENRTIHLAVDGKFGQSAYTAEELYQKHGLSADHIAKAAKQLLL